MTKLADDVDDVLVSQVSKRLQITKGSNKLLIVGSDRAGHQCTGARKGTYSLWAGATAATAALPAQTTADAPAALIRRLQRIGGGSPSSGAQTQARRRRE